MSGQPDTQQAEVTVRTTRYTVSALPGGGINSALYSITVEPQPGITPVWCPGSITMDGL